jgi:hypothetical protein
VAFGIWYHRFNATINGSHHSYSSAFWSQTSPLRVQPLLVDCQVANSPEMAQYQGKYARWRNRERESQKGRIKLAVRRSAATFSVSPQSEAQLVNWLRRAEPLSSVGRAQRACRHRC